MRKQHLIIIPFHLPWDWSADYQRQTCLVLAQKHLVIAYLHHDARFFLKARPLSPSPQIKNIIFFQPRYPLPFRRFAVIEKFNQLLVTWYLLIRFGRGRQRKLLWIFDPLFWFYPFLRFLSPSVFSLYDCVDFVWSKERSLCTKLQHMEKLLIGSVDFFFVNSHALAHVHRRLRVPDALVPQGFRVGDFKKPIAAATVFPKDKPIIGYVGAIDHRIDFRLLNTLVVHHPEWQFVLWGLVQETTEADRRQIQQYINKLQMFPNITIGKSYSSAEVPSLIKQFDIAIIPHDVSQQNVRYSYPMKLFEYFYEGKPVVATPIEELKRFSKYVKIGKTAREWVAYIKDSLEFSWPKQYQQEQKDFALQNSWENKVTTIFQSIY